MWHSNDDDVGSVTSTAHFTTFIVRWQLCVASSSRSVDMANAELSHLKGEVAVAARDNEHLRAQVERLTKVRSAIWRTRLWRVDVSQQLH
jgi:hypothetical protein